MSEQNPKFSDPEFAKKHLRMSTTRLHFIPIESSDLTQKQLNQPDYPFLFANTIYHIYHGPLLLNLSPTLSLLLHPLSNFSMRSHCIFIYDVWQIFLGCTGFWLDDTLFLLCHNSGISISAWSAVPLGSRLRCHQSQQMLNNMPRPCINPTLHWKKKVPLRLHIYSTKHTVSITMHKPRIPYIIPATFIMNLSPISL